MNRVLRPPSYSPIAYQVIVLVMTLAVAIWIGINLVSRPTSSKGQNTQLQGQNGTGISIVHLPDPNHTECAVMDSPQGQAISCDWRSNG